MAGQNSVQEKLILSISGNFEGHDCGRPELDSGKINFVSLREFLKLFYKFGLWNVDHGKWKYVIYIDIHILFTVSLLVLP